MSNAKWQAYPRPQLKRESYKILNGMWELDGKKIEVPFPPQSKLSGYKGSIKERMVYKMKFVIPSDFTKPRILLHFGAVDEEAVVYVNDVLVGKHEGGYLPFSFDISHVVHREKVNSLRVEVKDTLSRKYPYGKQCKKRGGMWYTPVSGIWQTVWLENVPAHYIEEIKITPSLTEVEICIKGDIKGFQVVVFAKDAMISEYVFTENVGTIKIEKPIHWTVENPYLYDMTITTEEDEVNSYFALRTIEIKKIKGINRVCLNGTPIFMHGILDQGYFEDGIYLPEKETEFEQDILRMKELGFNMLRKHIKIEPERFYYACDKLGMLVFQDMINNGGYSYLFDTVLPTLGFKKKDDCKGIEKELERKQIFEIHMEQTLHELYNHPCIIGYTIFNEGWGQFESDRMYDLAKSIDNTRLYDATSGWFAQKKSDFDSEHIYFRSVHLKIKERPMFLSECGGFSYRVDGHIWNPKKTYGYGNCNTSEELTDRIVEMYKKMVLPTIEDGLCGCVYTQLSDVEDEINGMYTYDREICKVNKNKMQILAKRIR
ncbi:MAG: glycoside hydrolase family 2, partial [Lachnospiraceae bacterium]|nr:glycoside hydrolase family 2 [Lachnospiraceae bacterium]